MLRGPANKHTVRPLKSQLMAISQCCILASLAARSMQAHRKGMLGCPSWLLNLCLIYYVFSLLINTFSTRLRHLAKHVYTTSVTMFSAFVTMIR